MQNTLNLVEFARAPTKEARPSWLKSDFEANVWVIEDETTHPNGERDNGRILIDFAQILPGGRLLTDAQFAPTLKTIKWLLLLVRRGGNPSHARRLPGIGNATNLFAFAHRIFTIFHYMLLANVERFSDLRQIHAEQLLQKSAWGVIELLEIDNRFNSWIATRPRIPKKKKAGNVFDIDYTALESILSIPKNTFSKSRYANDLLVSEATLQGLYVPPCARQKRPRKYGRKLCSDTLVLQFVRSLRSLYLLRDFGVCETDELDLICFLPWAGQKEVSVAKAVIAREKSKLSREENLKIQKQSRTASLANERGLELMNSAIQFVNEFSDTLLDLRDIVANDSEKLRNQNLPSYAFVRRRKDQLKMINAALPLPLSSAEHRPPWPFHYISMSADKTKMSLHHAVNVLLPAACYIILAGFSARRASELLSIRSDCLSGPAESRYIEIYSAKYLRSWELFPVVPIMEKAVEVLTKWSEGARDVTGKKHLFQYLDAFAKSPVTVNFRSVRGIRSFVKFYGIDLIDVNGETVELSEHQFRRLFANLFLHSFAPGVDGKFEALTHQLRHRRPSVTEIYVRDVVSGKIYDEVQLELSAATLTDVMLGKINNSGGASSRFLRVGHQLRTHYQASIQLVPSHKVKADFERWLAEKVLDRVHKVHLAITPLPWGYCFGRSISLRRAALCNTPSDREALKEPNLSNASLDVCMGCTNSMRLDVHMPCIKSIEESARAAMSQDLPPVMLAACQRQASSTSKAVNEHKLSSVTRTQIENKARIECTPRKSKR